MPIPEWMVPPEEVAWHPGFDHRKYCREYESWRRHKFWRGAIAMVVKILCCTWRLRDERE